MSIGGEELLNSDFELEMLEQSHPSELKEGSNLQLSDTPLGGGNEPNFPEELKELDTVESEEREVREENMKVDRLVDEILHWMILRDVKDKPFPLRPLNKLTKLEVINRSSSSAESHSPRA